MAIPDEGPTWMDDYKYLSVDIDALDDVGKKLSFELGNFVPHAQKVYDDMAKPVPQPLASFEELVGALSEQRKAQQRVTELLSEHATAIDTLAKAATTLSSRYRDADAFAAAKAKDVEGQFVEQKPAAQVALPTSTDPNAPLTPITTAASATTPVSTDDGGDV